MKNEDVEKKWNLFKYFFCPPQKMLKVYMLAQNTQNTGQRSAMSNFFNYSRWNEIKVTLGDDVTTVQTVF